MPEIKASPRNRLLGAFADVARNVNDFAAKPFGYDNPPVAMMAGLLGLPAVANTLNELSYGGALGTGSGMTWKPKADTVDAAMTLLPLGATAGKAAIDGGVALARKAAPAIERAVPRVMERGGLSSQLLRDLSQNTVSPATVWHGSPHKFDKFDASKIGTGEGAQAYGHGLYLAESDKVAKQYADTLTDKAPRYLDGVPADQLSTAQKSALGMLSEAGGNANAALLAAKTDMARAGGLGAEFHVERYNTLRDIARGKINAQVGEPSLYKVDLPDDAIAKMLDWDKPLSQQPAAIQQWLKDPYNAYRHKLTAPDVGGNEPTGGLVMNRLQELMAEGKRADAFSNSANYGAANASRELLDAGIPGIRYLDGGSRGTGAGTSNFVVFPGNEGLLTILERNGQPVNQAPGLLAPKFVYPQEQALLTAQKNAALPVEQGGLGLRPDNTPMERAKAMGFENGWAHGSPDPTITELKPSGFGAEGPGAYATNYLPEATTYSFEKDGSTVYPLMVKKSGTFETGAGAGAYAKLGAENDAELLAKLKAAGKDSITATQPPTEQWLVDAGAPFMPQRQHFVSTNTSNFRSPFAAFDPMRRHEADLLGRASPGLLGLIGGGTGLGLLGNQWLTDR